MYQLSEQRLNSNCLVIHLTYADRCIGSSCLFIDNFDCLHIQLFQIEDVYQGCGHGRQFYQLLEASIRDKMGFRKIHLQSTHQAYSFWLKMGYRQRYSFDDILIEMEKII